MRRSWWKILSIVLLLYTFIAGFLVHLPYQKAYVESSLYESMRNFFFHVPMWFSQCILLFVSMIYSIIYLSQTRPKYDFMATELAKTGTVLGCLGLLTGMIWAKFSWGAAWSNDPKQIGV